MSPGRLLSAVFASLLMLPVSCTLVTVPAMRVMERLGVRDLQAGEKSHLPPLVAVVDGTANAKVELIPLEQLAERRARTPTLTPWLPVPNGSSGEGERRELWRQVASSAAGREMEVVRMSDDYTHTFRYAVSPEGAVRPLRSKVSEVGQMFVALAIGVVVALLLRWLALRARRRPPPLPAPQGFKRLPGSSSGTGGRTPARRS